MSEIDPNIPWQPVVFTVPEEFTSALANGQLPNSAPVKVAIQHFPKESRVNLWLEYAGRPFLVALNQHVPGGRYLGFELPAMELKAIFAPVKAGPGPVIGGE